MERQNKYHVIISERATQMVASHAAFLARVSIDAAERLATAFEDTAYSLETMPHRCQYLMGEYIPRNIYRTILFEQRYLIIFQIIEDTVYVDYVVDCRQDYGWLLK